jgi:YD repeat-containing protein
MAAAQPTKLTDVLRACSTESITEGESFNWEWDPVYAFNEGSRCGGALSVGGAQNTSQRIGRDADCGLQLQSSAIDRTQLKFGVQSIDRYDEVLNAVVATHGTPTHVAGDGGQYVEDGMHKTNLGSSDSEGQVVDNWLAGGDNDLELRGDEDVDTIGCQVSSRDGFTSDARPSFDHRGPVDGPTAPNAAHRPYVEVTVAPKTGARPLYPVDAQQVDSNVAVDVNAATGNLLVDQAAATLPSASGPAIRLGQTYNSKSADPGALGAKWVVNSAPDVRIEKFRGNPDVALHDRTGIVVGLDKVTRAGGTADARRVGEFDEPYWLQADLSTTPSGYELQSKKTGAIRSFANDGRLLSESDAQSRKLTYRYDTAGALSQIDDADGRHFAVTFSDGKITTVRQVDDAGSAIAGGARWDWSYDALGRLTDYVDANGSTTYGYNAAGRLAIVSAPGSKLARITYDSSARVESTSITDSGATVTRTYRYGVGKTTATATSGPGATYYFDQHDKLYAPDTIAPTLGVTPKGAAYVNGMTPWPTDIQAEDDRSGVHLVDVRKADGTRVASRAGEHCGPTASIPGWESASGVTFNCDRILDGTLDIPTSGLPEGHHAFRLTAVDGASRASAPSTVEFSIDRTAPSIAGTVDATLDEDDGTAALTWMPATDPALPTGEPGSGVDHYEVRGRAVGGTWGAPTTVPSGGYPMLDLGPRQAGNQIEYEIKTYDTVGNVSVASGTAIVATTDVTIGDDGDYAPGEQGVPFGTPDIGESIPWKDVDPDGENGENVSSGASAARADGKYDTGLCRDKGLSSPCGTYSGKQAGEYARKWALTNNGEDRNRDYDFFENDCTNFVSQAIHAGGMHFMRTQVNDPRHNDPAYFVKGSGSWWSQRIKTPAIIDYNRSNSWSVGWVLFNQLRDHGLARVLAKGERFRTGDIIFYWWDGRSTIDKLDHVQIVAAVRKRQVFIAQHTSDRLESIRQWNARARPDHKNMDRIVLRPTATAFDLP